MQGVPGRRVFSPKRLSEATKEAGLTQQGLAVALGMHTRSVQMWFLGENAGPVGFRLIALAELLNREPGWFYVDPEEVAA